MRTQESGNALFYVLIAVVLLGALTYAVTQTLRGGETGSISDDRARLMATDILDGANSFAAAVSQIRLRGAALNSVCFDDTNWGGANYNHAGCTDPLNKIYDPEGGGIAWSNAPEDAMDSAATPDNLWHFYADNEIENVGSTAGDATSVDLIVLVDELSLAVCQQINDLLGVTGANVTPPVDTSFGTTRYIGTFSYTATIGDEDAVLAGKSAACFQKTAAPAEYVFYKVLVPR